MRLHRAFSFAVQSYLLRCLFESFEQRAIAWAIAGLVEHG